ncbi:hypothetical protein niasHT_024645 [Heterodera trifolii]|uniref:Anillin homology domain-containing protein n=1 Tax=Heterodera trifolii TaxID=157864 RepID=A0ABD2K847_9BILA
MLKFQRPASKNTTTDSPTISRRSLPDRRSSFVSSQLGHSRAVVVIRKISVPLAWPVEEYFSARRDWREFTLQLVFRTSNGKEYFSKPIEKINPTFTDVNFPDEFVFPNQGHDFVIELTVYCKRTDKSRPNSSLQQQREIASTNGPNKSFLEMLRKAGEEEEKRRSLGLPPLSLDEHLAASDGDGQHHQQHGQMCAVGNAHFRLQNASLAGRLHNYAMDKLPALGRQELLPIYGSICAQILVQPGSLVSPLAQGSLDIFMPDKGILHQRLRCSLQGGLLKCWNLEANSLDSSNLSSRTSNWSLNTLSTGGKVPILTLLINESTRLEKTAFPTAFRLIASIVHEQPILANLLCICSTRSSLLGWRNAMQLQLMDCSLWSDFALRSRNPHGAALGPLADAAPSTFQRLIGIETAEEDNDDELSVSPQIDKMPNEENDKMQSNLINEMRPRISSSASMLIRNGGMKLRGKELDGFEPKNVICHQKTVSRTTLLDTSGQLTMNAGNGTLTDCQSSAPATPALSIIRRKTIQSQSMDEGNNNHSPSILRRFSQRPKHNISWSLREGICPADLENAATDFYMHNSMNLSGEPSFSPPIIEEEREESEKIDKNKLEKTDENGGKEQPNYVISLQISSDPNGLNDKTLNSSHENSPNGGTTPIKEKNANANSNNTTTTTAASAENDQFIHRIKVNESASICNASSNVATEKNKNGRPFNVTDLPQTVPARWARAHVGRAETWHFARIGEACTRL